MIIDQILMLQITHIQLEPLLSVDASIFGVLDREHAGVQYTAD